jgi:hypothetical protein
MRRLIPGILAAAAVAVSPSAVADDGCTWLSHVIVSGPFPDESSEVRSRRINLSCHSVRLGAKEKRIRTFKVGDAWTCSVRAMDSFTTAAMGAEVGLGIECRSGNLISGAPGAVFCPRTDVNYESRMSIGTLRGGKAERYFIDLACTL